MSIYDKSSLVLIPSGTKAGKVYSQKPVSGDGDFTFTRSSAATRVNASGNIEKETSNLLLQSNTFDTTWSNVSTTDTGNQADKDGGTDAWKIDITGAGGWIYQDIVKSGVLTYSVYAKAGSVNFLRVLAITSGTNPWAYFDLLNGNISVANSACVDSSIEDVGNGWYRCSITFNDTASQVRIYPAIASEDLTATSGNIYIQDAQLNQGLIAQEVITTTTSAVYGGITDDVPRLDYTDSSCPALLLEPQRTNSFPHSEYLGQWSANRLDRTANNIDSPEGVQNAYKMIQQSGFTTASNINYAGITAGTKTLSIFAKAGTFDHIALSYNGVTYFNLTNGTIGTTASGHTAVMTDMGDGWYRCAITKTTTATYTAAYYFAQNNGTLTTTDTQGYMYAYGAQIEAGSYATSYIPTYGSSVTRIGETYFKTGASSIIGQAEGSVYLEITQNGLANYTQRILTLSDGTNNNVIGFQLAAANSITFYSIVGGVVSAVITKPSATTQGEKVKIAAAYAENDFVLYIDGVQVGTDNSGTNPSTSIIQNNRPTGGTPFIGEVHNLFLFKTRLSNEELAALTTI